jgi:hypothetical protein
MHIFLLALLLALPAQARRHPVRKKVPQAAKVRAEDDPRKNGASKAFAKAALRFAAPKDGAHLDEDAPVEIDLRVSGYALGALQPGGPSPHAHLVVDGEGPLTVDDASKPFALGGLSRGPHVLRAVLCRPWHEVVKARHAFAMTRFWVGPRLEGRPGRAAEAAVWPDPRKPILTLIVPLGAPPEDLKIWKAQPEEPKAQPEEARDPTEEQHADLVAGPAAAPRVVAAATDRPIVDFYLANARVGRRGDKVRVVLDRRELPLVTEWKPLRLQRAHHGGHKATVDLLDRRGLDVKNALNRTERRFQVR